MVIMGCVSSQTFEVEEELVDPEDYNYDPVLILSGRRQSVAPASVQLHRIKKISSIDAESHNRDMVMHLSDPVVVQGNYEPSELSSLTRKVSFFGEQPVVETNSHTATQAKRISIYRRQSTVEVATPPPGSPPKTRRVSILRRQSSHNEVCIIGS